MKCECIRCGATMNFGPSRAAVTKYCSQECYRLWRWGHYIPTKRPGFVPANAIAKGERRGIGTEFKKGIVPENKLPVGSETIRTNHKTGDVRGWVKIAEPNVWRQRAVVVWERENGPLPKGFVIHHIDRNSLNDSLDNLALMSRTEHLAEHRAEQDNEARGRHISAAKTGKKRGNKSFSVAPKVPIES